LFNAKEAKEILRDIFAFLLWSVKRVNNSGNAYAVRVLAVHRMGKTMGKKRRFYSVLRCDFFPH
jgi:hypothetical protein